MDNIELLNWINEMPQWFRKATMSYYTNGTVTDEEITKLADECIDETDDFIVENINIINRDDSKSYVITSLDNIEGVNALEPRTPLQFSKDGVTVVYGLNGAGKSGYIRVLKMITGAKYREEIKNNIYSRETNNPKATITIENNVGEEESFDCDLKEAGQYSELRNVDIFDTKLSNAYINDKKEAEYEPWVFRYLSYMAEVSTRIKKELERREEKIVLQQISIPDCAKGTDIEKMICDLSFDSRIENFPSEWNDEDDESLKEMESINQVETIKERINTSENKKRNIELLSKYYEKYVNFFDDDNWNDLLTKKSDWEDARKERLASEALFKDCVSELDKNSVDFESWKSLWKYAKEYYNEYLSDKEKEYTLQGGYCPLCGQTINDANVVKRMKTIDEYVNGKAYEKERKSYCEYDGLLKSLPNVKDNEELTSMIETAGLDKDKDDLIEIQNSLENLFESIEDDISKVILSPIDIKSILKKLDSAEKSEQKTIDELKKKMNSDEQKELRESINKEKTKKWCVSILSIIKENIEKLKQIQELANAKRKLTTNRITTKGKELAKLLISAQYILRFNNELAVLSNNSINAQLEQQKAGAGKIPYKVMIQDIDGNSIDPEEILSEGEKRAVSLAAFFAESEGRTTSTPLIVDDPISSLDYRYEEGVVDRLVEAAKQRQVIVFTHRISMAVGLHDVSKKKNVKCEEVTIESNKKSKGVIVDFKPIGGNPKRQLNKLINEDLSKLKNMDEFSEDYKESLDKICTKFRNIVEKSIENYLLNRVVLRFRKNIVTNGTLEKLSEITLDDCKMFDGFMTKYSCYDHSMSDETPLIDIEIDDLEKDLKELKEWLDNR